MGKNLTVPGTDVSARKPPNTIPAQSPDTRKGFAAPALNPWPHLWEGQPHGNGSSLLCAGQPQALQAAGPGARPGPLGSMRTRPLGLAPTRRGPSPAPAPHPRIADVHNGGGTRSSQRVVNAQSAAAALQSDTGAARPRLGLS